MLGVFVAFIIMTIVAWFLGTVLMDVRTYRELQRKLRKEREKNE